MKQLEYTIKVTTDTPIEPSILEIAMHDVDGVHAATVTNWRVLPVKREKA
jgi:hypothetical protein